VNDNSGREVCSSSGQWGSTQNCQFVCIDSSATCGGECKGTGKTCDDQKVLTCQSGFWAETQTCDAPEYLCVEGQGCDFNEPYYVGYYDAFSKEGGVAKEFTALKVTLSERVELTSIGIVGPSGATYGAAFALYDDDAGYPGNLRASTGAQKRPVNGRRQYDVVLDDVYLNPGTYWIVASWENYGQLAYMYESASGATVWELQGISGSLWPSVFPDEAANGTGPTAVTGIKPNFYIEVRTLP